MTTDDSTDRTDEDPTPDGGETPEGSSSGPGTAADRVGATPGSEAGGVSRLDAVRSRVRSLPLPSAWVAATLFVAGVAAVAGSYALSGFTPKYVVGPLTATMTALMPDVVIRYAITVLGSLGQKLNVVSATALGVGIFSLVAAMARTAGVRSGFRALSVPFGAVLAWAVAFGLTRAPIASLGPAAGLGAVLAAAELATVAPMGPPATSEPDADRRRLLGGLVSTVVVSSLASLVAAGRLPAVTRTQTDAGGPLGLTAEERDRVDSLLAEADEKSLGVSGIEPLVSEDFYEVDISAVNPTLKAEDWTLSVTGAVENEVTLDYEDLRGMESDHRFVTLRCVGEGLNGHKTDNALWTGTPASAVLEEANPQGQYVVLRAADDYFEEFPLAALQEGLFAYGMNGELLPRKHGYPVRALVPGHWGEINVKWLTEIEVRDEPLEGYWERRGWHGTGPVNTVAKLHDVSRSEGTVQVSGHAYAGLRGVSAVEVSTDGGSTWDRATLSEALPGDDVWRQWTYEYDAPGSEHEVVVRAIEADGTVQPRERSESFPSGATGWVSRTVEASQARQ